MQRKNYSELGAVHKVHTFTERIYKIVNKHLDFSITTIKTTLLQNFCYEYIKEIKLFEYELIKCHYYSGDPNISFSYKISITNASRDISTQVLVVR